MIDAQKTENTEAAKLPTKKARGKRTVARRPAYKVCRLNARLAPDQKHYLERAAELTSQSLSDFVIHTAMEGARRVILEKEVLELSKRDSEIFAAAMLGTSGPNEALKRAAAAHADLIAP